MKRIISEILKSPCRCEHISDDEKQIFSKYSYLQRYYPGLDNFVQTENADKKYSVLPAKYSLISWKKPEDETAKYWVCNRIISQTKEDDIFDLSFNNIINDNSETISKEEVKVFVKVIHLLDPIGILKQEYMTPEHPLLPQGEKAWRNTLQKLHAPNNQAYVDAVANYILGCFRERDLTPHCILSYGSMTGIASSYKYQITDEFESYRQCRWFWRGMKTHGAKLNIIKDNQDILAIPELFEQYKEILESPFDSSDKSSITELSSDNMPSIENIDDGIQSIHSFNFTDEPEIQRSRGASLAEVSPLSNDMAAFDSKAGDESDNDSDETEEDNEDDTDNDTEDDSEEEVELNVNLEIPSMPVILVYQEYQSGTMDELLEMEEINGFKRGSKQWEKLWLAWIWQVIAALGFLQKSICFTHNDLHTNNVLWRETSEEFLYYKSNDGTLWRVPTYGKIFSLIDFGRAIFRLGKQLWISDDHWPGHDAGGQYNFGPIYNMYETKIPPNPSFDLCRLSISLLDGLFDDVPDKRKGKMVPPLSQDGSWIVYETNSSLFNLLYSWTIDDDKKTIYETEDGEERFPGFELYIYIARKIHNAVPREQFRKPMFENFRFKGAIPSGKSVYSLGS
jgi:hypothetical protein